MWSIIISYISGITANPINYEHLHNDKYIYLVKIITVFQRLILEQKAFTLSMSGRSSRSTCCTELLEQDTKMYSYKSVHLSAQ